MGVSCNIDTIINYLIKRRDEGYKTVELIDVARRNGWKKENPTIDFIVCEKEPTVLGIDLGDVILK